jgi:heme A synthase
MTFPFIILSVFILLVIFGVIFSKKLKRDPQNHQKIDFNSEGIDRERSERFDKKHWSFVIALLIIILVVVVGAIVITEFGSGCSACGQKSTGSAIFPWVIFIPIWLGAARKKGQPTPFQKKILMGILIITGLLVLGTMILWFFLS